ncbi:MAG: phosphoribosyltransferase [Synechococcaceae bacterium WB6_3B_236]|nr:phosphoribosyltransferase [Synechococcaceae bacterium WB6_3B_236]
MTASQPRPQPAPVRNDTAGELVVNWEQYHRLIEHLAVQLHSTAWEFDQIIALSRGGLRVGDLLSRVFDRPLVVMAASSYSGEGNRQQGELRLGPQLAHTCASLGPQLLLVDDLADSGATLAAASAWLEAELAPQRLRTAVLWLKASSQFKPDLWAMELPANPWILQPFEHWDQCSAADLQPLGGCAKV